MTEATLASLCQHLASGTDFEDNDGDARVIGELDWHDLYLPIDTDRLTDVDLRTHVLTEQRRQTAEMMQQIAASEVVAQTLDDAGINCIFLKGAALSQTLFASPTKRYAGDIDIWIDLIDVKAAVDALMALDYHPDVEEFTRPEVYKHYLFLKKDISCVHETTGIHVELHWRLMDNPSLCPISFESAWRQSVKVSLFKAEVHTLCTEDNAIYIACHGTFSLWAELKWAFDWHMMLSRDDINWDRVARRADEMGNRFCLINACENAAFWFGSETPACLTKSTWRTDHLRRINHRCQIEHAYPGNLMRRIYTWEMTTGIAYFGNDYLRVHGASAEDVKFFHLPAFWMYYAFRPILLLIRWMRR